jgi:steroid delta-isomerase-like uncharacterized protein
MEAKTASRSAEEVARSYFDAIARRDVDAIASHWSPDVVVDFMGQGIRRGPEEMREFFTELTGAIPDIEMTAHRIFATDDVAVVEWRLRGNFTGRPLFGIEPTGKWIEQRGADVIDVADGLIVRNTAYQDGIEMARSIGMMPPADSAGDRAMKQAFNLATRARRALQDRIG